jgi:cobalt-zinc-cadmium efflux system outer membrane protein
MAVFSAATLVAALTVGTPPPGTPSDTLALPSAIAMARAANPRLRAERLRSRASAERIVQAGAWPNPELGFGLQNRPLSNFGTEEMMTMNTVRLSQMVPWPGKQSLGRDGARGLAVADSLEADEADAMLVAQVKTSYYRIASTDRSLDVMRETLTLLRHFQETSLARFSVGATVQQDVLQAEVNVARMEADITAMEQERLAEAARFNALLARDPASPLGALVLPPMGGALPVVDSLARLATARPALAAADARVNAAAASVASARKELWPDLMFSVEYGQRPRYDDMLSLMVGVSVPVFSGSRQQPMRREMEAMQAMREADARDLLNETWARLAEMRAMTERARRLDGLYASRILPQAEASVESALSAYLVGEVDFMTLVESRMTVNQYAIERIRLAADYHIAVAEIVALLGGQEVTP